MKPTAMFMLSAASLWFVVGINVVEAFVIPTRARSFSAANSNQYQQALCASSMAESISSVALGDTSIATASTNFLDSNNPIVTLAAAVMAVVLVGSSFAAATTSGDRPEEEEDASTSFFVKDSDAVVSPDTATASRGMGVDRRESLMTLLGTAAGFAAGDVVLSAASKAIGGAVASSTGGAKMVFERVMAFGNKYQGTAIASKELTAWVATQKAAATPEIWAWLAAQRRLQMVQKTVRMATATASARTTRGAVSAGGVLVEEGVLVSAATAVVSGMANTKNTTTATATTLEATGSAKDCDSEALHSSSNIENLPMEESSHLAASAADGNTVTTIDEMDKSEVSKKLEEYYGNEREGDEEEC